MNNYSLIKSKSRRPTRKERGRYERWVDYLRDTKLTEDQIHQRAEQLTNAGRDPEL